MSGDNPFDDLAGEESEPDEADETEPVQSSPTSSTEQTASVDDREPSSQAVSQSQQTPDADENDLSGPAFEYSEVRQRPMYVRGKTWDRFEDELGITVVPGLRTEGVRDEEKRELHDAALEVAARHSDEILELVLEQRRQS